MFGSDARDDCRTGEVLFLSYHNHQFYYLTRINLEEQFHANSTGVWICLGD